MDVNTFVWGYSLPPEFSPYLRLWIYYNVYVDLTDIVFRTEWCRYSPMAWWITCKKNGCLGSFGTGLSLKPTASEWPSGTCKDCLSFSSCPSSSPLSSCSSNWPPLDLTYPWSRSRFVTLVATAETTFIV